MTENKNSNDQNYNSDIADTPSSGYGDHPKGDPSPSRPLPESEQSARYRLIYDDLCRYCAEMRANISSMRIKAVEYVVISASLLGLYFAYDAAADYYEIGWWGLSGILTLVLVSLPHFRLVDTVVEIDEFRLSTGHAERPAGEPERQITYELEQKAEILSKKSTKMGYAYTCAKRLWFFGVGIGTLLGVIEWLI